MYRARASSWPTPPVRCPPDTMTSGAPRVDIARTRPRPEGATMIHERASTGSRLTALWPEARAATVGLFAMLAVCAGFAPATSAAVVPAPGSPVDTGVSVGQLAVGDFDHNGRADL